MAIMLAKTYQALKAAGAPEEDAIAAAEDWLRMRTVSPGSKIDWLALQAGLTA